MLAYDVHDDYEIIEGVKFMSASANIRHSKIVGRMMINIGIHVAVNKLGFTFSDSLDIHFPDGNLLRPDFAFVSAANKKLIVDDEEATLHGVPDMVAEIFSRSTMKRDTTIKKDVYERNGVKEYWLINPWSESIEVFLLHDGKYELDEIYLNYTDKELNELTEEERAEVKMEVPVAVLDGFKIKIRNIFSWYFE